MRRSRTTSKVTRPKRKLFSSFDFPVIDLITEDQPQEDLTLESSLKGWLGKNEAGEQETTMVPSDFGKTELSDWIESESKEQNAQLQEPIPPLDLEMDSEDYYIPLNYKLLEVRQSNRQRRAAEMASNFFGIPPSRTFRVKEIEMDSVVEMRREEKSEYAIFLGRVVKSKQSDSEPKLFIACSKFNGFQLFVRLELTYGQIYGLVAMKEDEKLFDTLEAKWKCKVVHGRT